MSLVLLVLFIVLMFLGVPIAVSLGAASVITIITMSDHGGAVDVYLDEQLHHGSGSAVYPLRLADG